MDSIKNLSDYVLKDEIYQNYLKSIDKDEYLENCSDFDRFCIQHCRDIDNLLYQLGDYEKGYEILAKKRLELVMKLQDIRTIIGE